nr:hypothetical protein [uncultured Lichenicoccus sp.]
MTVTAPLRTGGDAMQCGRLTFHALLSAGVAVELRDDGCQEGADGVPVRITCLSGDRMADALPAAMSAQGGGFRILVPAWDLACFPAPALSTLGLVHEVWAPSRFIQIALAGHTDRPVIHMPLAIEPEPVAALPRSAFGLEEGRFAFLAWFDGRSSLDRTDPRTAIRAFRQAFPRRGRASLVLASHDGAVPPEQRPGIDAAIDGDPDIVLLDRTLTAADRQSLTAACDALLSLHRSEGLALATARAMLLDRPVIAPDYAASGEFVTARTGYPVKYRLVPVDGSCLAEIDASHAAWIMASLADDPRQADPLVARAHAQVRHLHGREAVAARQQGRLRALSRRPEQHDAG